MFSRDDPWWWFSFFATDRQPGEHLIGVAMVQACDIEIAKMALARFGIKPRGEAVYTQILAELGEPPELYRERLLSPDEAGVLADLMEARRPKRKIANLNFQQPISRS